MARRRRVRCAPNYLLWIAAAIALVFSLRFLFATAPPATSAAFGVDDVATSEPPAPSAFAPPARIESIDVVGDDEASVVSSRATIDAQNSLLASQPHLGSCRLFMASPDEPQGAQSDGVLDLLADAEPPLPGSPQRVPHPPYQLASASSSAPPLVSVLTPLSSSDKLEPATMASLLAQTLQQWEWLVAVDPSASRELEPSDSRIRILQSESSPRNALLNTCLKEARASFVFVLDAGDIQPTALDKLFWYLLTHNESAMVTAWLRRKGEPGVQRATLQAGRRQLPVMAPAGAMLMMRRDVLLEVGGYPSDSEQQTDWQLLCSLSEKGYWGVTVAEVLLWDAASLIGQRGRRSSCPGVREPWEDSQNLRFADAVDPFPAMNVLQPAGASLLLIVPFLDMGGADAWNLNVVKMLSSRGWRITVVSMIPWDHPWRARFLHFTPDVWDAPQWLPHHYQGAWLAYLIESRRIDVVMVSNTFAGYHMLPYLRHHAPRPVYVDFCHSSTGKWYHGGYPHASALYSNYLDRSIFAANNVRKAMLEHGGDETRTGVVYAGVNATFYARNDASRARVRAALGLKDSDVLIIYIGRLTLEKGPDTLAGILERLEQTQQSHYAVLVVGTGDWESNLVKRVERLRHRDRVRLLGARSPAQITRYLSAADVLLLPSRFEGIALVIYEAMAAGVVPVASDVGGQAELVSPDSGILVPVYNDESKRMSEFTSALLRLLSDPALLARMKDAARSRIEEEFSLEWMEAKLRAEFCTADADRRKAPFSYDRAWATLAAHLNHLEQQEQVEWKRAESKAKKAYMETVYRLPPW